MSRLHSAARFLLLIAAILALLSSITISFFIGGAQVTESVDGIVVQRHISWYESQGWWGIAILFIFSALYYGPLRFFDNGRVGMVYIFGLAVIALTILAMFSVGGIYIYSGVFMLLGLVLLSADLLTKTKRAP